MDINEIKQDIEMCELLAVCHFCRAKLYHYTTKKDWTYLANPDRSPHRKSYLCSHTWAEYTAIKDLANVEPVRSKNTPDYIVAPYVEL